MWLLHLHSAVRIQLFPVFPLAESMAEAFFWLFLWILKEKSINHFLWQIQSIFSKGCVQFYDWWFFQWKSIDKSSFHVWWCGPLSFFVHYMKSSFEELLRDLQIISKELFLSSWNLVSATNLNTALVFINTIKFLGSIIKNGWCFLFWRSKK